MKRTQILSDSELQALAWELRADIEKGRPIGVPSNLLVRKTRANNLSFPDGHWDSWQERLFMGTGVTPKG